MFRDISTEALRTLKSGRQWPDQSNKVIVYGHQYCITVNDIRQAASWADVNLELVHQANPQWTPYNVGGICVHDFLIDQATWDKSIARIRFEHCYFCLHRNVIASLIATIEDRANTWYTNTPKNNVIDTIGICIGYGCLIIFILLALASGVLNVKNALHYGEWSAWLCHGIMALLSFGVAAYCSIIPILAVKDWLTKRRDRRCSAYELHNHKETKQ